MHPLWIASGLAARAHDASSQIVPSYLAKRNGADNLGGVAFIILIVLDFIVFVPILLYVSSS
jgi:hypothetical protein